MFGISDIEVYRLWARIGGDCRVQQEQTDTPAASALKVPFHRPAQVN